MEGFLIRCKQPSTDMPGLPLKWGLKLKEGDLIWIRVHGDTGVVYRAGGARAQIEIGQTVSAWSPMSAGLLLSKPPQLRVTFVVVESDVR